jgi:hypothetical protein
MALSDSQTSLAVYSTLMVDATRWQRFQTRPGDIVISTPPKSGTTWMQMLCAVLVHDTTDLPVPLDELSPWLDFRASSEAEVFSRLDAQQHRRIIKTHTPLDGLTLDDDVVYIVVGRDPRDVMVSFEHHMANVEIERVMGALAGQGIDVGDGPPETMVLGPPDDPYARFRAFIDDDEVRNEDPSLASILRHLETGWERRFASNVGLFHYADLQADTLGEMRRLAHLLATHQDRRRLRELVEATTLEAMRAKAATVVPESSLGVFREPAAFFRTGGSGEWRDRSDFRLLLRYQERARSLVDDELMRWVHAGRH